MLDELARLGERPGGAFGGVLSPPASARFRGRRVAQPVQERYPKRAPRRCLLALLPTPRPQFSLFGKSAPRIAFLVDWLMDSYQSAVLQGARAAALERGVHLVTVPGGVLGAPEANGEQRNHLFDLVSAGQLDALIVLSGTLGNHRGVAGLIEFLEPFRGKPVVSIAVEVPEYSVVQVNNAAGMLEAVEHLIRVHELRRIAFIRGPAVNAEAEVRFEAYLQALERSGIPYDDRLVAFGKFQRACGEDAVRLWLDERGIGVGDLDAVVGAADLMVLGALDELTRRRIRVPDDVALVGFDDIEQARFTTPPLSTVRQPLFEQGHEAVRIALGQLSTGVTAERVELSTRFIGRRSCGCFAREPVHESTPPSSPRLSLEALLVARRAVLRAELSRASRGSFAAAGSGWEERLLNALADELGGREGAFVEAYDRVLQAVLSSAGDLSVCHAVVGALRRQLLRSVGDAATLRRLETLFHELRVITSEVLERFQANQRIQAEAWARALSQVSAQLVTSFEAERLSRCVRDHLPRLGIRSCFIARYVDQKDAELVTGYLEPGGEELPSVRYPAAELVPRGLWGDRTTSQLVVMPLAFDGQPFGFAVFELGQGEGHVYEALAEIIAAALRGAGLTALIARARESGHPLV